MTLEQIESNRANDSQVFGSIIQANRGSMLDKGDIQGSVKGIFKRPMGASSIEDTVGIGRQAGQEIGNFLLNAVKQTALSIDHGNGTQPRPAVIIGQRLKSSRIS